MLWPWAHGLPVRLADRLTDRFTEALPKALPLRDTLPKVFTCAKILTGAVGHGLAGSNCMAGTKTLPDALADTKAAPNRIANTHGLAVADTITDADSLTAAKTLPKGF